MEKFRGMVGNKNFFHLVCLMKVSGLSKTSVEMVPQDLRAMNVSPDRKSNLKNKK